MTMAVAYSGYFSKMRLMGNEFKLCSYAIF